MSERDELLSDLSEGRRKFLALVETVRPELHRYCARMTGSVVDGEDIVQEAMARAYFALSEYETLPPLRPWLFRIAHQRAIDHLRRYEKRMGESLDEKHEHSDDTAFGPEDAIAHEEATRSAVWRFMDLPPAQRSAVILKDVLGHSLEEIARLLDLGVPAVKAALHRGRVRLREDQDADASMPRREISPVVSRYVALFNAHDWDGVRALLSEDVQLDVVARSRRSGRRDVGVYFTNYDALRDWHLVPAWLEGREVVAVFRHPDDARPAYFVQLTIADERIAAIRDFRYVPYITAEAAIEAA